MLAWLKCALEQQHFTAKRGTNVKVLMERLNERSWSFEL